MKNHEIFYNNKLFTVLFGLFFTSQAIFSMMEETSAPTEQNRQQFNDFMNYKTYFDRIANYDEFYKTIKHNPLWSECNENLQNIANTFYNTVRTYSVDRDDITIDLSQDKAVSVTFKSNKDHVTKKNVFDSFYNKTHVTHPLSFNDMFFFVNFAKNFETNDKLHIIEGCCGRHIRIEGTLIEIIREAKENKGKPKEFYNLVSSHIQFYCILFRAFFEKIFAKQTVDDVTREEKTLIKELWNLIKNNKNAVKDADPHLHTFINSGLNYQPHRDTIDILRGISEETTFDIPWKKIMFGGLLAASPLIIWLLYKYKTGYKK